MAEELENVENDVIEQDAPKIDPIFLNNTEFSGLLNLLLINTKFFVATELKEAPKFEGDATVYLINLLVNNPVINIKSDLIQLVSKYSNNVQIINNPDLKGYHTVGVEIYVKDVEEVEIVKEVELAKEKKKPVRKTTKRVKK